MCFFFFFTADLNSQTVNPFDYFATELDNIGQDIVTLADTEEEFSPSYMTQKTENEAQGAVESFSFFSKQGVKTEGHDPTPPPFAKIHTTIASRNIPTTPAIYGQEREPTQSFWQGVLIKPIDSKDVHLEPSWNQPKSAEDQDSSASLEVNTDNHTFYQPRPDINIEPGEQVENKTFTGSKPNITVDHLEPLYEFREVKGFKSMHERNLDGSHVDKHLTLIESQAGNITVALKSNASLVFGTQINSSNITEGSGSELTIALTEKIDQNATLSQEDSYELSSSESTTESSFLEDLSQSTQVSK